MAPPHRVVPPRPSVVDALQSETGEGPCLDAIKEHAVFITGELPAEDRWPHFAVRAHDETGVTSILSLRLFTEEQAFAMLKNASSRTNVRLVDLARRIANREAPGG